MKIGEGNNGGTRIKGTIGTLNNVIGYNRSLIE